MKRNIDYFRYIIIQKGLENVSLEKFSLESVRHELIIDKGLVDTAFVFFGAQVSLNCKNHNFEFMDTVKECYKTSHKHNELLWDSFFLRDPWSLHYHKGIQGISDNIQETVDYLDNILSKKDYKKVIFCGVSMGGYASILFSSLCKKVDYSISFNPQTHLEHKPNFRKIYDKEYVDIKPKMKPSVSYIVFEDPLAQTGNNDIEHITRLEDLPFVHILYGGTPKKMTNLNKLTKLFFHMKTEDFPICRKKFEQNFSYRRTTL